MKRGKVIVDIDGDGKNVIEASLYADEIEWTLNIIRQHLENEIKEVRKSYIL